MQLSPHWPPAEPMHSTIRGVHPLHGSRSLRNLLFAGVSAAEVLAGSETAYKASLEFMQKHSL